MSLAMVVAAVILLVVAGFALSRTQNVVVRVAVVVVLAQVFLHRLVVPEQPHAGLERAVEHDDSSRHVVFALR